MNDLDARVEQAYREMQQVTLGPQAADDLGELARAARSRPAPEPAYAYPPCPVCGYRGRAVKKSKGSYLAVALLFLFSVLSGWYSVLWGGVWFAIMLVYIVLNLGEVWKCGNCGAKKADA